MIFLWHLIHFLTSVGVFFFLYYFLLFLLDPCPVSGHLSSNSLQSWARLKIKKQQKKNTHTQKKQAITFFTLISKYKRIVYTTQLPFTSNILLHKMLILCKRIFEMKGKVEEYITWLQNNILFDQVGEWKNISLGCRHVEKC